MGVWQNSAGILIPGSAAGSFVTEPGSFGKLGVAGTLAVEEPPQSMEPQAGRVGGSLAQNCRRVEVLQKGFATS